MQNLLNRFDPLADAPSVKRAWMCRTTNCYSEATEDCGRCRRCAEEIEALRETAEVTDRRPLLPPSSRLFFFGFGIAVVSTLLWAVTR